MRSPIRSLIVTDARLKQNLPFITCLFQVLCHLPHRFWTRQSSGRETKRNGRPSHILFYSLSCAAVVGVHAICLKNSSISTWSSASPCRGQHLWPAHYTNLENFSLVESAIWFVVSDRLISITNRTTSTRGYRVFSCLPHVVSCV
jgi:hypothetical protein